VVPQEPQLSGSVVLSVHVPLQLSGVGAEHPSVQVLLVQVAIAEPASGPGHLLPHAPQLSTDVGSTHVPWQPSEVGATHPASARVSITGPSLAPSPASWVGATTSSVLASSLVDGQLSVHSSPAMPK
jgi:hypothetical protein